jgi:predicted nucleic-acid-binding Zn-ribbon protein
MKSTQTCPKCAGKKFAVTAEFLQHSGHYNVPLPAVIVEKKLGRLLGSVPTKLGSFESWICLRCGYTELYAKGVNDIEELANEFPDQLRIVDGGHGERGPYR